MKANLAVNTDAHRRAFGRVWRPVTFIRWASSDLQIMRLWAMLSMTYGNAARTR
jgi:hypothetical protein